VDRPTSRELYQMAANEAAISIQPIQNTVLQPAVSCPACAADLGASAGTGAGGGAGSGVADWSDSVASTVVGGVSAIGSISARG